MEHEAAAALARSEAFLRSVLDAGTDCIKVVDADGHLVFMNANVPFAVFTNRNG